MPQANKECHCVRRINEDSQSKPHRKNEFKNV